MKYALLRIQGFCIMKKCSKCDQVKDLGEFKKDSSKKDGYYSSCKICSNRDRRKRYEESPEIRDRLYSWKENNAEKVKEYKKTTYLNNADHYREQARKRAKYKRKEINIYL
mgnify:CR=1 FL=1